MVTEKIDLTQRLHSVLMEGKNYMPGCLPTNQTPGPHATFIDEYDLCWMLGKDHITMDDDFDYIGKYLGDNCLMQAKITWLWMKEV